MTATQETRPPPARKQRGRKVEVMDAINPRLSAMQDAALNQPITANVAAQCLLEVAGIAFGAENAELMASRVAKRFKLSEAELRTDLPAPKNTEAPKAVSKRVQITKKKLSAYMLFRSFVVKQMHRKEDLRKLPIIRKFLEERGNPPRLGALLSSQLWASLPKDDKDRLEVKVRPFLEAYNDEQQQRRQQQFAGGRISAAKQGEFCDAYLEYVERHPEADLVRLLRLDGGTEELGAPGRLAEAATAATKGGGGPTVMSLAAAVADATDGSDRSEASKEGDEEEEAAEEDEDMVDRQGTASEEDAENEEAERPASGSGSEEGEEEAANSGQSDEEFEDAKDDENGSSSELKSGSDGKEEEAGADGSESEDGEGSHSGGDWSPSNSPEPSDVAQVETVGVAAVERSSDSDDYSGSGSGSEEEGSSEDDAERDSDHSDEPAPMTVVAAAPAVGMKRQAVRRAKN